MRFALLLGAALLASPATAQVDELLISECAELPAYDPGAMRYINRGPSLYGSWFYEVVYRKNRTVLLLDRFGNVRCEQPITRSVVMTQSFELNEQFGRAEVLASDVRAWLRAREIERCP